ncbi:tryptophan synthase subunit alpha [Paenibacillus sp. J2TS4]|uniref:tryptophan synthase subunit alpha n=1 Tax=Paenibacillus sp. J2TS4 TaxID=2807194 RepID=UPI001B1EE3A2|nr:tryptophan synthase subunit alpha [Paenibacillus sp. J2TS4]GIP32403.1 tryptophan synthase alpha chain [Paenibacillus sp. J2TS4]
MNLIDERFAELRERGETALMPFISVGDPDLPTSVDIILELEKAGADMVELGVPYSDPLADGPVIQRSSQRALKHHVTILDCIQTARHCREKGSKLPFILFTYYNPVLQLGLERFFDLLRDNDISGIIIPDLPLEENEQVLELSKKYNIHLIPLVAPTSNDRIARITSQAAGFIYCVSSLGVTGTRASFFTGIDQFIDTVKSTTELPVAIGFGISSREQVVAFSEKCDGVVVGSAIVRKIEEALPLLSDQGTKTTGLLQIRDFVRQLKAYNIF